MTARKKTAREKRTNKNVFINCPFDNQYIPLLHPLLFTVLYCGLNPRIASESFDSGMIRLSKVCTLISSAKYSIHDLSRSQAGRAGEIYRMNMPFELGVDFGCRKFGAVPRNRKIFLVLDERKYRYQRALSDISGSDIKHHGNNPENLVRQVRNWFVENKMRSVSSGQKIWGEFNDFMTDFYAKRKEEGFSKRDLQVMPIPERISFMRRRITSR